jgi:CheY-like chemotaxis protein
VIDEGPGDMEADLSRNSVPATPTAPVTMPRSLRVMVVDDNFDAADAMAELLRIDGHDVRVANEPLRALAMAGDFDPDVAILDIGLPGMDGYELARRLQARLPGRQLTCIAVSGYGQDLQRQRSGAASIVAHLVKPVDFNRLSELLAEV